MSDDIVSLAETLDTEGMIGFTKLFVDDLEKGQAAVNRELLPWLTKLRYKWTGVLFLGMGGSAAGGDFISSLTDRSGTIPIRTHRGYNLPSWWNEDWLIVATSYSGNTEETISATSKAADLGASIVVISSGGELAGMCELYDRMFLISCPGGQPPRSAFGHIFARQLALMVEIGILSSRIEEASLMRLRDAIGNCNILDDPEGDIASLALNMLEAPIAILGPDELSPALNRFKNQINENSARFARIGIFPEMNHNESVAWGGIGDDQDPTAKDQAILLLTWDGMHRRVHQRMDWFVANCPTSLAWKIHGEGTSLLESLLHLCIMMDWLSIALALLHNKNPSSIAPIISLKQHLSQID